MRIGEKMDILWNETIFLRIIANILHIDCRCISREPEMLKSFEADCCYEKTLQPMYTAESLSFLMPNIKPFVFYEITDYLNTNLILFRFLDEVFLVGPYVKNSFSDKEMQTLLAKHRLPASVLVPLRHYYGSFPQLSYMMVSGTIMAAMRTFFPSTPEYGYRNLYGFYEPLEHEEILLESTKNYVQIQMRYEAENYFMQKITEGDVDGVELTFENMIHHFYATKDKSQMSLYSINDNGFTVIRTLARKAAEKGGCPVVVIDAITQDAIQKASRIHSMAQLEKIMRTLLLDLTRAVRETRNRNRYSLNVRKAIAYIELNYTDSIRLDELSDVVGVSAEHLSRSFKKETSDTVTGYIAKLRMKKAAELLSGTGLSVSEIASYVGYSDSNYFVKVFKKHYGTTPSEYR